MEDFELKVRRAGEKGDRIVFEVWRSGEEEPTVKHEIRLRDAGFLGTHNAMRDTIDAFEKEVTKWLYEEMRKLNMMT